MEKYDRITQLFTTTEAKYVLLCMSLYSIEDATYQQIARGCGMEIAEVADAANMLKVIGANVSTDFNRVKLHDTWLNNRTKDEGTQPIQERVRDSVCLGSSTPDGQEGAAKSN